MKKLLVIFIVLLSLDTVAQPISNRPCGDALLTLEVESGNVVLPIMSVNNSSLFEDIFSSNKFFGFDQVSFNGIKFFSGIYNTVDTSQRGVFYQDEDDLKLLLPGDEYFFTKYNKKLYVFVTGSPEFSSESKMVEIHNESGVISTTFVGVLSGVVTSSAILDGKFYIIGINEVGFFAQLLNLTPSLGVKQLKIIDGFLCENTINDQ